MAINMKLMDIHEKKRFVAPRLLGGRGVHSRWRKWDVRAGMSAMGRPCGRSGLDQMHQVNETRCMRSGE